MSVVSRLEPQREVLDNGIVLLWNEARDTPAVAVRASFPAGSSREAPEEAGLAQMTARLLRRGTRTKSAQEIAAVVEDVGASFGVWGGSEEAGFSAKCLDRDLDTVLGLIQELLEEPEFAEDEIAKARGEVLTELEEQEDSPRSRADRALAAALYPAGHPYSRSAIGTPATVTALTRDRFQAFHDAFYAPAQMTVSVAGALDADGVRRRLEGWFQDKPAPPPLPDLRTRATGQPSSFEIRMPHKSQVAIILAGPGIPRDHPDYFPLSMISLILGGLGLMGRLGDRVRDEQGMAYSVYCRASCRLWSGEWTAGAGVAPANVERAIESILGEVRRIREELVTEQELQDARDMLVGSLPLRMETNDGIASYLLSAEYYSLGMDYLDRYPGYIAAVTREAMREAARAHMDPERFSRATAGPI
jgi:zinc protease